MRTTLLLLLALATSGCLSLVPATATFVLARVDLGAEGGIVDAELGWHCDHTTWSEDPPRAHLDPYAGPRPGFLLLRVVEDLDNVSSAGAGRVATTSPAERGEMDAPSLVAGGPPVVRIAWADGVVEIDGERLAAGATMSRTAQFEAEGAHVTERMTFTLLGEAQVTTKRLAPWSACR